MTPDPVHIRPIDPASEQEVALVAERMRLTLSEVLGAERGDTMYSLDWLKARVRWHLDVGAVTGAVLVAEMGNGTIVGHTIVRLDVDDQGHDIGLFSTIYVEPTTRRQGVAHALITAGERWMAAQGVAVAATYTAPNNAKLHRLFEAHGYALAPVNAEFVVLQRGLN